MADPITELPPAPSRQDPINFSDEADSLLGALDQFVEETNAVAVAMNLNDTNDVSTSSVAIGLGAKTFTVTAGKSFLPGMFLSIADDAAPSTNSMFGQITSYSGTTLIMNITFIYGSGTKTAWTISQSVPFGATGGPVSATTGVFTGLITATGGQIAFPATAVPSSDPNTLDDYEEGSFTVDFLFGGASVGVTYSRNTIYYTKVGDSVSFQGQIVLTSKGSSVGAATISGLPFSPLLISGAYSPVNLANILTITFADQIQGYVDISSPVIILIETTVTGVRTSIMDTDFSGTSSIMISGTYKIN